LFPKRHPRHIPKERRLDANEHQPLRSVFSCSFDARSGPDPRGDATTETVPEERAQQIERLYAAFNRRDVDTVLARLTGEVVWANGMDGGHVHGRDGVRSYWTQQFTQIRSTVQPQRLRQQPDGRVAVDVHQVVHSIDGSQLLADTTVRHVFTFDDDKGLVGRFDIE